MGNAFATEIKQQMLDGQNKVLKQELKSARHRISKAEDAQANVRISYYKELIALREQMFISRDLSNTFALLEIKHFDIAEDLPANYQRILNTKLDEMKGSYRKILLKFEQQGDILNKKVSLMEKIHSGGIKFADMKVEHLVKRVYEVD